MSRCDWDQIVGVIGTKSSVKSSATVSVDVSMMPVEDSEHVDDDDEDDEINQHVQGVLPDESRVSGVHEGELPGHSIVGLQSS